MSFNGSGVFDIDTSGQPVVAGTTIDATVFNALTTDLATGLSTCVTKDGQQTLTADLPMAGYKLTGLGTGTATTDSAAVQNVNARSMCEGRLTLTTGVPVTTSDVTAAETLYFTAYKGNCIALYDGTNWVRRTFSEVSIDVPDVTGVHDVFAYDNSGTVTLEVLVWTNDTTRATALTLQDGVLVKTGVLTRRYLGTFYSTTAGNGQIEDSAANRYLWNYYNRVARPILMLTAANHDYTTATVRQWGGSTANQVNCVVGYVEDAISADVRASVTNTGTGVTVTVGIGMNSTSEFSTGNITGRDMTLVAGPLWQPIDSHYEGYPIAGKNYLSMNQYSVASGTTSWIGSSGIYVAGIAGKMFG